MSGETGVENRESMAVTLEMEKLKKEWEEKKARSVEVHKVLEGIKLHKLRIKKLAEEYFKVLEKGQRLTEKALEPVKVKFMTPEERARGRELARRWKAERAARESQPSVSAGPTGSPQPASSPEGGR